MVVESSGEMVSSEEVASSEDMRFPFREAEVMKQWSNEVKRTSEGRRKEDAVAFV